MKPHEKILKMIEEVDPNDTARLDEIDARIHNLIYPDDPVEMNSANGEWYNRRDGWTLHGLQYTRSRDALKAIRSDVEFTIQIKKHCCRITFFDMSCNSEITKELKTEELCELWKEVYVRSRGVKNQ